MLRPQVGAQSWPLWPEYSYGGLVRRGCRTGEDLISVELCKKAGHECRFLSKVQWNTVEAENVLIRFTKSFLVPCRKQNGGIFFISR